LASGSFRSRQSAARCKPAAWPARRRLRGQAEQGSASREAAGGFRLPRFGAWREACGATLALFAVDVTRMTADRSPDERPGIGNGFRLSTAGPTPQDDA